MKHHIKITPQKSKSKSRLRHFDTLVLLEKKNKIYFAIAKAEIPLFRSVLSRFRLSQCLIYSNAYIFLYNRIIKERIIKIKVRPIGKITKNYIKFELKKKRRKIAPVLLIIQF
ncbi:hypothetical protein BpHYR1_040920 [Brachionus plicatilis]|uniref:Uncharacterized protein n=1 Tax=Brachionus plicatilis TaxID=10195 RepID=A0A3M7SHE4_BRAPC|nr:hypothetical protein BpHYR1_040920 [Brachionus plicatilis]